jgi:hypothetical protein
VAPYNGAMPSRGPDKRNNNGDHRDHDNGGY